MHCLQLLIVISQSTQFENLFPLLNQGNLGLGDECKKIIRQFRESSGVIVENKKVSFSPQKSHQTLILSFLIRKIENNKFMWALQDISQVSIINEEKEKLVEKESFQSGRVKLMETVIHDIGNTLANLNLGLKLFKTLKL